MIIGGYSLPWNQGRYSRAKPKSPSFRFSCWSSMMLSGFKSRCTIGGFEECKKLMALVIWIIHFRFVPYELGLVNRVFKSPPGQYSCAIRIEYPFGNMLRPNSRIRTIFACLALDIVSISWWTVSTLVGSVEITYFTAYVGVGYHCVNCFKHCAKLSTAKYALNPKRYLAQRD